MNPECLTLVQTDRGPEPSSATEMLRLNGGGRLEEKEVYFLTESSAGVFVRRPRSYFSSLSVYRPVEKATPRSG